jgi:hypothetical protein
MILQKTLLFHDFSYFLHLALDVFVQMQRDYCFVRDHFRRTMTRPRGFAGDISTHFEI